MQNCAKKKYDKIPINTFIISLLYRAVVQVNVKRSATFAVSRWRGPRLTAKKLSACGCVLGKALLSRAPSFGLTAPSAFLECRSGRSFSWSRTGRRRGVLGTPSLNLLSLLSISGLSDVVSPGIRWLPSASVVSPCVWFLGPVTFHWLEGHCRWVYLCRSAY